MFIDSQCLRKGFDNMYIEQGQLQMTATPHLSEARNHKVVSNPAKSFNEVRSHIKYGMLSKTSIGLPMKTNVVGAQLLNIHLRYGSIAYYKHGSHHIPRHDM